MISAVVPSERTCCTVYLWCTGGVCRRRRVLLDLGASKFDNSVLWFLRWYPLEFTEVHVFEARTGVFVIPAHGADENPVSKSSTVLEHCKQQYYSGRISHSQLVLGLEACLLCTTLHETVVPFFCCPGRRTGPGLHANQHFGFHLSIILCTGSGTASSVYQCEYHVLHCFSSESV